MLAAVLAVAFTAGADSDRAALALTLTHPTTPLAVALGRWLAASAIAGLCVGVACATRAGSGGAEAAALWRGAPGGGGAGGGPASCWLDGCAAEPPRGAGRDAAVRSAPGGRRRVAAPRARRDRGARRKERRGEDHAAAPARGDAAARRRLDRGRRAPARDLAGA